MDTNMMDITPTAPQSAAAPGDHADLIKDSSVAGFQADVIDQSVSVPVLVDFWAPWCGPCRQLGPALEKIVTEAGGKVKLVKVNIDENQALAGQMGVRSIPAVFAFSGGQPVDGFMGALPESDIRAFVEKILAAAPAGDGDMNAQIEQALAAANQAMAANQPEQAINIYGIILQQMPEHAAALIGLARAFIASGTLEQALQTLELVPEEEKSGEAYAAAQAALKLAEQAGELGEVDELRTRLEGDANDHQARMDLAILHNAAGKREEAASALLEIVKRDREWNEDGGRKKLLEFFEAWGASDPAAIAGRKKLSRLLFS
jgi:putative thioredoxin